MDAVNTSTKPRPAPGDCFAAGNIKLCLLMLRDSERRIARRKIGIGKVFTNWKLLSYISTEPSLKLAAYRKLPAAVLAEAKPV